jgi:hypothetical protein
MPGVPSICSLIAPEAHGWETAVFLRSTNSFASSNLVNSEGTPPSLTIFICNKTPSYSGEKSTPPGDGRVAQPFVAESCRPYTPGGAPSLSPFLGDRVGYRTGPRSPFMRSLIAHEWGR